MHVLTCAIPMAQTKYLCKGIAPAVFPSKMTFQYQLKTDELADVRVMPAVACAVAWVKSTHRRASRAYFVCTPNKG